MRLKLLLTVGLPSVALGQWTVVNLHPQGAQYSRACAGVGTRQIGYAYFDTERAVTWNGAGVSWVMLDPPGATSSFAYAADAAHQAGTVGVFYQKCAAVWNGSPISWVNLHPSDPETWQSEAIATSGAQQVGYTADWTVHAALWTGTAASWVKLTPPGSTYSIAYAVDGGRQGGIVRVAVGGPDHAALWSGTAASWIDLNPAGAANSKVCAIRAGKQAGAAMFGEVYHAGTWNGTAASWIDMHPAGAQQSVAVSLTDGVQAGFATFNSVHHAGLWHGTAGSWEDLSLLLPGAWAYTHALSVWTNAGTLYVAGYGYNNATQREEALLWSKAACYPNCDGSTTPPILNTQDFACFLNRFASGNGYANCDGSSTPPLLNVRDFVCFINRFSAGCS